MLANGAAIAPPSWLMLFVALASGVGYIVQFLLWLEVLGFVSPVSTMLAYSVAYLISSCPVSYTHLDVYKRQLPALSLAAPAAWPIACCPHCSLLPLLPAPLPCTKPLDNPGRLSHRLFPSRLTTRAVSRTDLQDKKEIPMAFDFKKEYRDLYLPKTKPALIDVPAMTFVAVAGAGNPNEENGAYADALGLLYLSLIHIS